MFKATKPISGGQIVLIPQDIIFPNPYFCRNNNYAALDILADSIRENGILQPIFVRSENDGYQVITGGRRLMAAKVAGLTRIPCIIMDADDPQAGLFTIIENTQRSEISFFDCAEILNILINKAQMNIEYVSKKTGLPVTEIYKKLSLLSLPEDIKNSLIKNNLSEKHALLLLQIKNNEQKKRALNNIIEKNLTAQQTENLIKNMMFPKINNHDSVDKKSFNDVQILFNSIDRAIEIMRSAGVHTETEKIDSSDYLEYTIRIPKTAQTKINRRALNDIKLVK